MAQSFLSDGLHMILEQCRKDAVPPADVSNYDRLATVLTRYCSELQLFNSAYDLVGADSADEIIVNHILDSLAALPVLQKELAERYAAGTSPVVADAGSGGGLPGIPLAAAFPHVRFELLERMSKRCAFLENCVLLTGLSNVTVINREIERCSKGAYDVVTFRAFRPLDAKMTAAILALRKPGGCIAAYKAKEAKIREEMAGIADIVPSWRSEKISVPFLDGKERHIVLF